jgi:hypothetical protein
VAPELWESFPPVANTRLESMVGGHRTVTRKRPTTTPGRRTLLDVLCLCRTKMTSSLPKRWGPSKAMQIAMGGWRSSKKLGSDHRHIETSS